MKTYDVTFQRKDFTDALKLSSKVSDVCEGEDCIKAETVKYLPKPNPSDKSKGNNDRYDGLLNRAVFYNVTGNTLQGLIGTVFKKEPTIVLPPELEFLKDDVNGRGVNLVQQSKRCLSSVLKTARHGLFVDYPNVEGVKTRAQIENENIRPTIISIRSENIPNWRVEKIGGVFKLTLVVIREMKSVVTPDGFGEELQEQYRVLKLVDKVFTVELYTKNQAGDWVLSEGPYTPENGKGQNWNEIPFVFVGAENNDTEIDKIPLLDLANLNLAHYRNSAWYEDSAYFVGQPQPWVSNLDEEWRDWLEEKGFVVGSSTIMMLPKDGQFGYAQVSENTLAKEAMDQKEEQMKGLGARILEKGQAVKTATEAQSDNESEHSVLSLVASNVSQAYKTVLSWAALYVDATGEIEFTLNQDFVEHNIDAQMLTALVGAWQAGRLPSSDYWSFLRKRGMVDPEKTDEDLDGEVENNDNGLGLEEIEPVIA